MPCPLTIPLSLQATLLLLEMLDVDKALAALASGQPIDEASYVFAAPGVKQRVNAELSSWWSSAAATHSPVLLAWSAVLCLIRRSTGAGFRLQGWGGWGTREAPVQGLALLTALGAWCGCCSAREAGAGFHCPTTPIAAIPTAGGWGEGGGSGEWEAHASKAHETDALGTLCQLTTHVSLNTNVAEIFNNIVLRCAPPFQSSAVLLFVCRTRYLCCVAVRS